MLIDLENENLYDVKKQKINVTITEREMIEVLSEKTIDRKIEEIVQEQIKDQSDELNATAHDADMEIPPEAQQFFDYYYIHLLSMYLMHYH